LPYRAFSEFKNDTLVNLVYDFETRSSCYKGKTIGDLLKDLELKPIAFTFTISQILDVGTEQKLVAIDLYVKQMNPERLSELKDYYITVVFESPFDPLGDFRNLRINYNPDKWVAQHYEWQREKIRRKVLIAK